MPRDKDIQHSILIVSSSDRFALLVKISLKNYITIDTAKSSSLARRYILEKDYALVVIDSPLPDETGEDLALDITERRDASVMLVAPEEISGFVLENAADHGILVVRKPAPAGQIDKAIRFLTAVQNKMVRLKQKTRKVEEKLEESRAVNRAKLLLVEKKGFTEETAHKFIGKQAMNRRVSRKRIAQRIIEDLDP